MHRPLALYFLTTIVASVENARILAVYPFPLPSHQTVFRTLTYELAERGHELVVIAPFQTNIEHKNIRKIDTSDTVNHFIRDKDRHVLTRGIYVPPEDNNEERFVTLVRIVDDTLDYPEVKELIRDKSEKFDLIFVEAFFHLPLLLANRFNAPLIWFSSFYASKDNFAGIGANLAHPLMYPSFARHKTENLSFSEKISQLWLEYIFYRTSKYFIESQNDLVAKHFGDNAPSIYKAMDDVDLLFVNVNPLFEGNLPIPPNVIYLGGLQVASPAQNLSQEWQTYLSSSKRGVVYVSFGTCVDPALMDADLLEDFLNAFGKLPYDVIWRYDGVLPRKPANLRTEKWVPQIEIIKHPNVKAFVTQGGLQSIDEAIDATIPLVGIPMMNDHGFNCERVKQLGIGVKLDVLTFRPDELVQAVQKVIGDDSYKENMKRLRTLMKDQPTRPLERAVWWTEYVIRNKGAKHLRSASGNTTLFDFLIFDVLLVVLILISISFIVILVALKYFFAFLKHTLRDSKVKTS